MSLLTLQSLLTSNCIEAVHLQWLSTCMISFKTGKSEWTVRVRAQSIWKGVNRQTQEFRGLNVIFIDDSVTLLYLALHF